VMRVLPYGARAALVDLDAPEQVVGLHSELDDEPPTGTVELVSAARTLLVRFDPRSTSFERLSADIARHSITDRTRNPAREVVVPVRYDGADLAEVARLTGFDRARGGRAAFHRRVHGRVLRIRSRLRLSDRFGPGAAPSAAGHAADAGTCRRGRHRR